MTNDEMDDMRDVSILHDSFVLFEDSRSLVLRDNNKFCLSPLPGGRIFFRFPSLARVLLLFVYAGSPDIAGRWGISLEVARAITLAVFLTVAQGDDAIYGFVWRCNIPSKPRPGGPNPELRRPGNDLVNRTAIMIS